MFTPLGTECQIYIFGMFSKNTIWIVPLLMGLIVLFGHFIPTWAKVEPQLPLPQFPLPEGKLINPKSEIDREQLALNRPVLTEEELLSELERKLKPQKVLQKGNFPQFVFGKGQPLLRVADELNALLIQYNCPISDGLEIKERRLLEFEFHCSAKWRGKLQLKLNPKLSQDPVQLAVVFRVDSALGIQELSALNEVSFPYTILSNPFRMKESLPFDLQKLSNKETLLEMPMEPLNYPYTNPGPQTLLISHSKEKLHKNLNLARERLPSAVGIAPFHGGRATQHKNLMKTLFGFLNRRGMAYLSLHPSERETVRQWCTQSKASCQFSRKKSSKAPADQWIERAFANAQKGGQKILLLDLTTDNIQKIRHRFETMGESGLELVLFSELNEREKSL